jgi:hypothetical protein
MGRDTLHTRDSAQRVEYLAQSVPALWHLFVHQHQMWSGEASLPV